MSDKKLEKKLMSTGGMYVTYGSFLLIVVFFAIFGDTFDHIVMPFMAVFLLYCIIGIRRTVVRTRRATQTQDALYRNPYGPDY